MSKVRFDLVAVVVFAAIVLASPTAQAVNKCVDAAGRTTLSDKACPLAPLAALTPAPAMAPNTGKPGAQPASPLAPKAVVEAAAIASAASAVSIASLISPGSRLSYRLAGKDNDSMGWVDSQCHWSGRSTDRPSECGVDEVSLGSVDLIVTEDSARFDCKNGAKCAVDRRCKTKPVVRYVATAPVQSLPVARDMREMTLNQTVLTNLKALVQACSR